jgi:hypothetical protein
MPGYGVTYPPPPPPSASNPAKPPPSTPLPFPSYQPPQYSVSPHLQVPTQPPTFPQFSKEFAKQQDLDEHGFDEITKSDALGSGT